MSASDRATLRDALTTARHAFRARADGTHAAWNEAQGWLSIVDASGFTVRPETGSWEWGLELRVHDLGCKAGTLDGATMTTVEANRLSRRLDGHLEEWFVNDERGLEQGWTLPSRPAAIGAGRPLRLRLGVRGSLQARRSSQTEEVEFLDAAGRVALTYGGLKAWDADGRTLPARMSYSGHEILVEVDEEGARYPVTIDPLAASSGLISQRAYLKASNAETDDQFGFPYAVAVSGDTVVIGAQGEDSAATGVNGNQADNSAPDSGAAYVFVREAGEWTQQAYLKASNTGAGDLFGSAVAISGDTIVVGAYAEASNANTIDGNQLDNSLPFAGAVYVFVRNAGVWSQQAYLKASNTQAGDHFGQRAVVSGDTLVAGAPDEDSAAAGVNGDQSSNALANSGAAYVFERSGGQWAQTAYVKAVNPGAGDGFASFVALSGDTFIAGARGEDSSATGVNGNQMDNSAGDSGAAYVYTRANRVWRPLAYLKASNTSAGDGFGRMLALDGYLLVISAPDEAGGAVGINGDQSDDTAPGAGAAYAFSL